MGELETSSAGGIRADPDRLRRLRGRAAAVLLAGLCVLVLPAGAASGRALAAKGLDSGAAGYVLVYDGPAVCDGCAAAAGDVAEAAGLPVRYVAKPASVPGLLAGARAFVVPGTEDDIESMRRSFNRSVRPALRTYLQNGGRYWGLCGGAFLAVRRYWATETQYVEALGIVPANAETYGALEAAHLEKVRWYGRLRSMYFEGGPYFTLTSRNPRIKVLATYADGSVAALSYRYGKGKVIVSGPHPEATPDWLVEDGVDPAGWPPTFPLAVAMLEDLLS